MANSDEESILHNLKRKRTRERKNTTRFITEINGFNDDTSLDDLEYSRDRLQETLSKLGTLDDAIHDLLSDAEYDDDVERCEEYLDTAKRAIQRASRRIGDKSTSEVRMNTPDRQVVSTAPTQASTTHSVRLPPIRLEPFSGDVETWSRFWEQFESSIDKDPSLSTINKHIFLRGYLEEEPKQLVDGIAVIAETYEETKKILQARYGDKNRIIQAHLDYLEDVKPIRIGTPEALNTTYIDCNRRVQALRALGEDVNGYGRILAPKILRAFPEDICRRWIIHVKRENLPEGDILKLMEFLGEEVDGALTAQKIRGDAFSSNIPTTATLRVDTKTASGSRKGKSTPDPFCVFCESRGHWAQDCKRVTDVHERVKRLRNANRCFLCLNRGHSARDCSRKGKSSCIHCKMSHHRSICSSPRSTEPATHPMTVTSVNRINAETTDYTYLQTARVWVTGPTGLTKLTRCVLDGGSQASFVTKSIVDELQLQVVDCRDLAIGAFEKPPTTPRPRKLVRFSMKSIWTNATASITGFESTHAFSPQPAVPHDVKVLAHTKKLQLADPKERMEDTNLPIEILIGSDHYWEVVKDNSPIRISSTVVLIPSKFGWILSGNRSGITVSSAIVNYIHSEEVPDDTLRQFWDLETLGIRESQDRQRSSKDLVTLQAFEDSYYVEDDRRVVSLPRKEGIIPPTNRCNAEKRFHNLEKRLQGNEQIKEIYQNQMMDYIAKGHVELVPIDTETETHDEFYLPHQLVKKEKRGKTKWRIVFDASAREGDGPSLNDTLEIGPNLLPEVLSILLRFRTYRMAIIGDIAQAFLQLKLDRRDRDLTRFFWYSTTQDSEGKHVATSDATIYRFTRLPFGLTCSPFLLSAALRELAHLHKSKFPHAASLIDDSTFMDDFAAGGEDDNQVISLYYELTGLMNTYSLPMAKWATNSEQLRCIWEAEGREIESDTQVLGGRWDTSSDVFYIDHRDITQTLLEGPASKRQLLRVTSRFYDVLGLLTPVSITGKLLFQDTWCRGMEWDELLPPDLGNRWQIWISSLSELPQIRIPRWIGTSEQCNHQLHVFCDASERAYGAAIYVRSTKDDCVSIHLACSKNRLAPVKKVTLPRLELLAALVGARLLNYLGKATGYDTSKATLWTDSTVTLGWIRSDPNRWKTFVSNRVTEIQTLTTPSQWRHCPGEENPADHLSRGVPANQLKTLHAWWHGPTWLSQSPCYWPHQNSACAPLPEEKSTCNVLNIETSPPILDPSRFSSYWRLLRVSAWVLRFLHNLRGNEKDTGELTATELRNSRAYWIQVAQRDCFPEELHALQRNSPLPKESKIARFNPFLEDSLIRLGGRLQFSELSREQRHPLLLDGSNPFVQLLIRETHIRLHHLGVRIVLSELRTEFWILRARQAVKKILRTCLPCKMAHNPSGQAIEAPLPADRVTPLKPFHVTGIDFAGPLFVKVGGTHRKCYIALFTCATTRAIHLELCSDMSTDTFLLALQRFAGRRGLPHTIYTDNARSFHAANKELASIWTFLSASSTHRYLAQHHIQWKFIAPRAAWWGGWWERMVGTTKRCLRKVLGKTQINEEALNTTLVTIEATINSRPIAQDVDNSETLTPAHFLTGQRLTTIPTGPEPEIRRSLTKELAMRQKLADDFWKRWTKEYLLELRSFHEVRRPHGSSPSLRVNDVVLLKEDSRPRHMWKRARVEDLRTGRDGIVRTVILRTPGGERLARPVQLVIPLEIDQGGEDVAE